MEYTTAREVYDSFESSFRDKNIIPEELELVWLKKAIGRYSIELTPINFNEDEMSFETKLNQFVIDTLAEFMKQLYQEREVSKANKRVSIVTKDASIDAAGHTKTAVKNELDYIDSKASYMIHYQKDTAYN